MNRERTAAALAETLSVGHEVLPVARALEDAAITAWAPFAAERLRAVDRAHDRAMAALRTTYREREKGYDDEESPEPRRDIWGLDALALVLVALALALVPAGLTASPEWDAPRTALACAAGLAVATGLHGVNALRSRGPARVNNARASSVIGFDAVAAIVGAGILALRPLVPRDPVPLAPLLPSVGIATACGIVLLLLWRDARRRGAPERDRVRRYRVAEASWRADLDHAAAELAAGSRRDAAAAFAEADAATRTAITADLDEATRTLLRRGDVPDAVVRPLRTAPFGHLRYGDRV